MQRQTSEQEKDLAGHVLIMLDTGKPNLRLAMFLQRRMMLQHIKKIMLTATQEDREFYSNQVRV